MFFSCEQRIRGSRIIHNLTRLPLQNPNEHNTAPEDAMQVPDLPPSSDYEFIVTTMDVCSGYLFAYPTSNKDVKTIAKLISSFVTKRAYLPMTLILDKGSAFVSQVIKEAAVVSGITLKHATTERAETIGMPQRSEASIKQALKIETGDRRSLRQKYVSIAVLIYNTSYHAFIGCEPSRVFHGRIPCKVLDLKLVVHPQQTLIPSTQFL